MISFLVILALIYSVYGGLPEARRNLKSDILARNKVLVTPRTDNFTVIHVNFTLLSVIELNEQEQSLTTKGWFDIYWEDSALAWNESNFNVSVVYFQQKEVWTPDLIVSNSLKDLKSMGYADQLVRVASDGSVQWVPGDIYKTKCTMDIRYFPFDSQICKISVSPWMTPKELELSPLGDGDLNEDAHNSLWSVTSLTSELFGKDTYYTNELRVVIALSRSPTYYNLNILLPVILISTLIPLVFALPADMGDRAGLTVTILLSFVVFLSLLSETLPKTSRQTSVLAIFITCLFVLSVLSVALSVLTLNVGARPEIIPISGCLAKMALGIKGTTAGQVKPADDVDMRRSDNGNRRHTWQEVAAGLDRLFFIFYVVILFCADVGVVVVLATKPY